MGRSIAHFEIASPNLESASEFYRQLFDWTGGEELSDGDGRVESGAEADAFARYIGGHLAEVNEGKTYSETRAAARKEGLDPDTAADRQERQTPCSKGRRCDRS